MTETAVRTVLVLIENADAALRSPALEALTLARTLGMPVALTLAEPSTPALDQLADAGVDRVLFADLGEAPREIPAVAAVAVAAAAAHTGAGLVLLTSSFVNKEIAAHTAWRTGAGLLIDVTSLADAGGRLVGGKRVFAGTWDTECAVTTQAAVATLRPNALTAQAAASRGAAAVEGLPVAASSPAGLELLDRVVHEVSADASGVVRPALAEAAVVVAGGRGTAGDFGPVEDLADALGAAIGSTRDAVDEGWIGHDAQVGQTGVTIAPRVYIGAGISGAPHHHGGMQAARTIIAVNTDSEAPLVELSDFAVIGDLHEILPAAAAAIRSRRAAQS
ncbi:electron transfer flavoprotein subunit alpha/FixB family protein [Occultella glacieicola]|uniref:Electron transfer flavoprotein subunit alpha/FixB family protein n=1 Tax=Occultella glacieicola TaxID=2518684 RepID=A0ABY2E5X5_9MICO|nr:electron transfer flavoprotein subunit alpha/FixB family protein [Occultella glacieicola]TDE95987.1 electron transfer flavoprotein subunit alpha/FixB family protein [Occultella glacieicola]